MNYPTEKKIGVPQQLVEAIQLDLVGPTPEDTLHDDDFDGVNRTSSGDDETTPEAASARKALFPSSMGLSFLVPKNPLNWVRAN